MINDSTFVALLPAISLTALIVGVVMYLQYSLLLKRRMRNIEALATEIDSRISQSLEPIDSRGTPKEIIPIINALNRLIAYEEDRYTQERDFTANASHELRTPLAGIRLQTQIAMRTVDKKQQDKAHKNILKAIDRATHLVEQLLTLSRLTADRVSLRTDMFNVERVVTKVMSELSSMAKEKKITLSSHKDKLSMIHGNPDTIAILIHNLIRNAIIYTPLGGKVHVTVQQSDNDVTLRVADNGPGISPEKRENIMQRFQKADTGTKTGTGLGLAIVKRVADLHNTKVELGTSEGGQGLTVTIRFSNVEGYKQPV